MDCDQKQGCVVLLPGSGMGHLGPFISLAATLSQQGLTIIFVCPSSTISAAESDHISAFLSSHPTIRSLRYDPHTFFHESSDPFFLQYESLRRSSLALRPLLTDIGASTPVAALLSDIMIAEPTCEIAAELGIPNYIVFTSSATMLSFAVHFSNASNRPDVPADDDEVTIPGVGSFPAYCFPPAMKIPSNLFAIQLTKNCQALTRADGVLANTFYKLESAAIEALISCRVIAGMPRFFPMGPLGGRHRLSLVDSTGRGDVSRWLDEQGSHSVVYVSFGSRHALTAEQIMELAAGLENSSCKFLWAVKTKVVDKEESQGDVKSVLPDGFVERVKERGLVVQGWVDQGRILGHPAVGGFLSHCGWNSMTEALWHGVPVFAWPQFGDQMFNAIVVEKSGGGVWERDWRGDSRLINGEEIGRLLKLWMEDGHLREGAQCAREEARKAVAAGGDSYNSLFELVERWKKIAQ